MEKRHYFYAKKNKNFKEESSINKFDETSNNNESFNFSNIQFGTSNNKVKNESYNPIDDEYDLYYSSNIEQKDNFTLYFNSAVYAESVDYAITLLKNINRNIAITELTYPELKDKITPKIIINSPGGDVIQGFRLFDAIKNNVFPVTTIGSGEVSSMGMILLVAGSKVQSTEHTVMLIHPLSAGVSGQYPKLENYMNLYSNLQEKLSSIIIDNSRAKKDDISNFMKGDSFIMAADALKLGIIDEIINTI